MFDDEFERTKCTFHRLVIRGDHRRVPILRSFRKGGLEESRFPFANGKPRDEVLFEYHRSALVE